MKSIIFLDVDGVLNCSDTKDKICGYRGIEDEKVFYLKQIVDAFDAEIVLSSDWRTLDEDSEHYQYLVDKLAKQGLKISDKTPDIIHWNRAAWNRASEIAAYLAENVPDRFLILDDIQDGWARYDIYKYWYSTVNRDFFSTMPGLTQESVNEIIEHMDEYVVDDDFCEKYVKKDKKDE